MNAPVVHWQMLSSNPDGVAAFYADVFGWSVSAANGLGYRTVAGGSGGVDGGIWPAPAGSPELVQLFIRVSGIGPVLAEIEAKGGKILMPRQVLPDGDAMALALDPFGRSFGLTESRK